MVDVAKVRLFGQNIGTFVCDDSYRVARFEYDNDFVGKGTICKSCRPSAVL